MDESDLKTCSTRLGGLKVIWLWRKVTNTTVDGVLKLVLLNLGSHYSRVLSSMVAKVDRSKLLNQTKDIMRLLEGI